MIRQPFVIPSLWLTFALWVAAICMLSSMSGPELEPAFEYIPSDKVAHFVAFAVGGGLLALAVSGSFAFSRNTAAILAMGGVALFGAIDEWHQTFTPQRSGADIYDWIADVCGGVVGAAVVIYFYGKFRRETAY